MERVASLCAGRCRVVVEGVEEEENEMGWIRQAHPELVTRSTTSERASVKSWYWRTEQLTLARFFQLLVLSGVAGQPNPPPSRSGSNRLPVQRACHLDGPGINHPARQDTPVG
ncbi:hypothetical protein RTBOTA2_005597 [Rhodotorula toruloides]|nr:hypothetical protein RTBOTA2_005597 [Rhodotorula toruloides]